MKSRLFTIVALLALATTFAALKTADAAIIKTVVSCRARVDPGASATIHGGIDNLGGAHLYNAKGFIYLGEQVEMFDKLGDLPPGGNADFQARFDTSGWTPGEYGAAVLVFYEERSGRVHKSQHITAVTVGERRPGSERPLSVQAEDLAFNPKAFWQKPTVEVALKNRRDKPLEATITPHLTGGYVTAKGSYAIDLAPGAARTLRIPIEWQNDPRHGGFGAVVSCIWDDSRHAQIVSGAIRPEPEPVYFRLYAWTAGIIILVWLGATAALALKKRRSGRR